MRSPPSNRGECRGLAAEQGALLDAITQRRLDERRSGRVEDLRDVTVGDGRQLEADRLVAEDDEIVVIGSPRPNVNDR